MVRRYVEQQLEAWARESAQRARRHTLPPIRVLVLGPGSPGDDPAAELAALNEKRHEVVNELRDHGLTATTPEELLAATPELASRGPIHHVEEHQLESSDFVIVLLLSPGTIAEVAGLIARRRSVARRSAVFYNAELIQGGYMDLGPLENLKALGVTHAYSVDDLIACRVRLTAIQYALDQAESLRGSDA